MIKEQFKLIEKKFYQEMMKEINKLAKILYSLIRKHSQKNKFYVPRSKFQDALSPQSGRMPYQQILTRR
ncbi:MAG: hypothetical protein KatS3mg090_0852 [Patescibacteria group bacterium]|nr:MAG: hypothetical protein KatS3mg090_0852 [Patescibacteria group bacterium]